MSKDFSAKAAFQSASKRPAYVAQRDIKHTDAEKAADEILKVAALKGVCQRCQDKVQWRFKYDKYKPLKMMGACSGCRKKNLKLNYRTLCEECAIPKNVCPSCCEAFGSRLQPDPNEQPPALTMGAPSQQ